MKKTFKIEDLDCANCAEKMERALSKIEGVTSVQISFMQQRMVLEAQEERFDEIVKQAQKVIRKIEPDARILA